MVNTFSPGATRKIAITQIKVTLDQIDNGSVPWTVWQERTLDQAIRAVNSGFYGYAIIEAIDAATVPAEEQAERLRARAGFLGLMSIRSRAQKLH